MKLFKEIHRMTNSRYVKITPKSAKIQLMNTLAGHTFGHIMSLPKSDWNCCLVEYLLCATLQHSSQMTANLSLSCNTVMSMVIPRHVKWKWGSLGGGILFGFVGRPNSCMRFKYTHVTLPNEGALSWVGFSNLHSLAPIGIKEGFLCPSNYPSWYELYSVESDIKLQINK